ncbi:hypothetical protein GJ744_012284 [Endocarpon pusillum]|uniref:Uncharacterized protein n=1 Tax=Endocarpon pusillum TaxID=364733 RepID=A0A8H7E1K7_9EURO|nr:hypothetical protein GJ744_012284 [Endocarpon pusillum]
MRLWSLDPSDEAVSGQEEAMTERKTSRVGSRCPVLHRHLKAAGNLSGPAADKRTTLRRLRVGD